MSVSVCMCVYMSHDVCVCINVELRDSNQYVISVGLPNVESGLEVKVEWQYTHAGQTLHRFKTYAFFPLRGTVTVSRQFYDRCVCVVWCVSVYVCVWHGAYVNITSEIE